MADYSTLPAQKAPLELGGEQKRQAQTVQQQVMQLSPEFLRGYVQDFQESFSRNDGIEYDIFSDGRRIYVEDYRRWTPNDLPKIEFSTIRALALIYRTGNTFYLAQMAPDYYRNDGEIFGRAMSNEYDRRLEEQARYTGQSRVMPQSTQVIPHFPAQRQSDTASETKMSPQDLLNQLDGMSKDIRPAETNDVTTPVIDRALQAVKALGKAA